MGIDHLHWDIYSRLKSLRKLPGSAEAKRAIELLSAEVGLSAVDSLIVRTLTTLPWVSSSLIEGVFFCHLREKYSYSVLSPRILETLANFSPMIEVGAGNGYNAWILRLASIRQAARASR